MRPLTLNRSSKGWLISSILVILVSIGVFAFRRYLDEMVVLLVVILTPVLLLALALVFGKLAKKP
jgi:hypothetical protein